jgi:hypothetical protein
MNGEDDGGSNPSSHSSLACGYAAITGFAACDGLG